MVTPVTVVVSLVERTLVAAVIVGIEGMSVVVLTPYSFGRERSAFFSRIPGIADCKRVNGDVELAIGP